MNLPGGFDRSADKGREPGDARVALSGKRQKMGESGTGKVPRSGVRLSRAAWDRVLKGARRVAAEMAARKRHLELEGWSSSVLLEFDTAAVQVIQDRIEVHLGTIGLLRHTATQKQALIPVPQSVRKCIEGLIGRARTKEVLG